MQDRPSGRRNNRIISIVCVAGHRIEGNEALFDGLYVHDRRNRSVRHPAPRLSFGSGRYDRPGLLEAHLTESRIPGKSAPSHRPAAGANIMPHRDRMQAATGRSANTIHNGDIEETYP